MRNGAVVHVLASLDLEALVQLTGHELQLGVEQVEEQVDVALGADGQTGQVDGREATGCRGRGVTSRSGSYTLPMTRVRQPM